MPDWQAIGDALADRGVSVGAASTPVAVPGGDINDAWRLDTDTNTLFLKTGHKSAHSMFVAEAEGLAEIDAANAVRVPAVMAVGATSHHAFIAMEWLDLERPSAESDEKLGAQLAAMHRVTAPRFGWKRDNTIGRTPQQNAWTNDWIDFLRVRRLVFQLELAARNGHRGEMQALGRKLCDALPVFFEGYEPVPSLLHGDLWGGNRASMHGEPVIFDPAVYYGDRESDIAMTRLFGSFSQSFYRAYESSWPMAEGGEQRIELYQLYHLLNHLNLFGSGYAGSVMHSLHSLCRDL